MPKIKIEHVVSCSSEDPDHSANNLLNSETKKKWKCSSVGENSISVIFQLEKSSKISGIDIGNENSSFIEVLVGRSSSQEQDYKILLATSSFMTPMDARNLTNSNRVRMFTYENFASTVRDEKWDRIKIVCTQPFNKHVQYGLSFITLHEPQEQKDEPTTLGRFKLRPESPTILTAGSLFAKRKELNNDAKPENTKTVAQSIKDNEKQKNKTPKVKTPSSNKTSNTDDEIQYNRNRRALFFDSDDDEPNEKIDKAVEKLKADNDKKKPKTPDKPPAKKKESKTDSPKPSSSKNDKNDVKNSPSNKRKVNTTPKVANKKIKLLRKPFQELFSGVVFTISGIVNPERANLRTNALAMGAKYRPDWDNSCTHLICAFANTPKFNQVRGKGKIVTKSWIKDSFDQRKRLPWRRYALDRNDQGKPESEDEIEEQTDEPEEENPVEEINLNENYNMKQATNTRENASGSDTDDEIERILAKQKKEENEKEVKEEEIKTEKTKTNSDKEECVEVKESKTNNDENDTEEEELKKNPAEVEDIPRIFQSEIFYIDPALEDGEKNKLDRLIKAFDGVVLTSLRNIVDFVITNEDSVELIKESCSDIQCVSSNWIYECHDVLKRIPHENFIL